MKTFTYPNSFEWKATAVLTLSILVITVYLEVKNRNLTLTWSLILVAGLVASYGIYKQYSYFNRLMEVRFEDDKIIAKRWGGISSIVEMKFSEIKEITCFELDQNRKGLSISDEVNIIWVGDSIVNYDKLLEALSEKVPILFKGLRIKNNV